MSCPDVILLDINMPEMNGIEACKLVKKEFPNVKVIALSMISESNLIKLMLKNGADGYLHKMQEGMKSWRQFVMYMQAKIPQSGNIRHHHWS